MSEQGDLRRKLQALHRRMPLTEREKEIAAMLMPEWAGEDIENERAFYGPNAVKAYETVMDEVFEKKGR